MMVSRYILIALAAAAIFSLNAEEKPSISIEVNPYGKIIKDVSKSPYNPDIGLAGDVGGVFGDLKLSYIDHREATARAFRESGIWLVRPCGMLNLFDRIKKNPGVEWTLDKKGKCSWIHPKHIFSFWKEYGIKAVVCLNLWNAEASNQKLLEDFLVWIKENGWEGCVSGFEMCNEPFYGKDPEGFADSWRVLLKIIRKHMPKVGIGLPLAEYTPGDPDIAAARSRLLGEGKLPRGYFTANNLNQWSAKTVVALGKDLTNVTHIIYHVYGAAPAYGCSYTGFRRFRDFAKKFPEIADKRWWITEWRPWSDENLQLQRMFHYVIWAGMYAQTCLCQPELDAFTMHEMSSLSGVMYISAHGTWSQYYDSWENGRDLKVIKKNDLKYEVGGMGAMFSLFAQAVKTHPLVVGYGSALAGANSTGAFWASAHYEMNGSKKKECQWTAMVNSGRSSLCIIFANGSNEKLTVPVKCYGYRLLSKTHRFLTCDHDMLYARDVPGEEKLWRRRNWETLPTSNPMAEQTVTVPANSFGTVFIGLKKWDEWGRVHYGRELIKKALKKANSEKGKDKINPTIECCGIRKGKVFMVLPDGYPNNPELKNNLPARKVCEEIGKNPKKIDEAAVKKAEADGYKVYRKDGNAVWVFKANDIPKEDAPKIESQLKEMAGF
jgi:hypothetical protein